MTINQISFQKAYKINASISEFHQIHQYLEKNHAKNKNGYPTVNSKKRVFDDMTKTETNFRFIDDNGELYILSGKEGRSAWDILFEMMDSWAKASKENKKETNEVYEKYGKIANEKIKNLISHTQIETLEVSWINNKPIFNIIC